MTNLSRLASERQEQLNITSDRAGRRAANLWRQVVPVDALDAGWDQVAPQIAGVVTAAQVSAARQSGSYVAESARLQNAKPSPGRLVAEAFGGATREGRELAAELFAAVTTTKSLIGRGVAVPQAFRAGTAVMQVMAATMVRDAGRSADHTLAVGRGSRFSIRVVQPGACSRCAILAGVKGYRADFKRHPGCRCTSMPLFEMDDAPAGFFTSPEDYFDSLSESEQDRVFTKAGAAAIREGADPIKVVNARRGALTSTKRPDGTFTRARLQPVTIGKKADGSPLQVYATREGATARSGWASQQGNLQKVGDERYRRTTTLRLMPEQIMQMSSDPARIRELLQQYGYMH